MIPFTLFFFCKISWLFLVPCISRSILNHLASFDEKSSWDSDRECSEAVDETKEYFYLNNIKFSNPQTQANILFILSSFNPISVL